MSSVCKSVSLLLLAAAAALAPAQTAPRIAAPIDDQKVVTLWGNIPPQARAEFDQGPLAPDTPLNRIVLQLAPSPDQQAELDALVAAQHDPASPLYHQWLTPAQYGSRFGIADADLAQITAWLTQHGFTIDEILANRTQILFSGSAGAVEDAFHTQIHRFRINGEDHIANTQDPQIPAALASVVNGIVSLHDFRRVSQIRSRTPLAARPQLTAGSFHYLFPADWAAIYDLNPPYQQGINGSGVTIALVGRSNITLSDVTAFRQDAGLAANNPTIVYVNSNPGLVSGDQDESTLDVEWAGAVAPSATVKLVTASSTATSDGVDLSAQYIVNHASAAIMSTSYGSCEADMGSSGVAFYNSLWEQAASEGISAFVSSGDSGAAGCDSGSSPSGSVRAVNGLCSSPYVTCVGGTEFNEGSNPSTYWSSSSSASGGSALGYIPEEVWNESAANGGSGLWASGGGASVFNSQPAWQQDVEGASAAGGMRAVPDVAVTAASHDGYIIVENASEWVVSGTSAASPSFAGLMALVAQSQGGSALGSPNATLYPLAHAAQTPFHSTPGGNNSVPGVSGYFATGAAYNLATGLGSPDAALLIRAWASGSASTTDFALALSASSGSVYTGKSTSFTVSITESGAGKNKVSLQAAAPSGVTVAISPATLLPGSKATVTVTVSSSASTGTKDIVITGTDTTGASASSYTLTVAAPPTLTLNAASSSVSIVQGATGVISLTAVTGGSFSGSIALSVTGLPSGVTARWSANPLTPSGSTTAATLTLAVPSTAAAQSSNITIQAVGDGLTATKTITLQVQYAPGVLLSLSPTSLSFASLSTTTLTVTATPVGGVVAPPGAAGARISIVSGLPSGITASWSAPALASSGSVSWKLTLTGSSAALTSSTTLDLTASIASKSGQTYSASATVPLRVTYTPPSLAVAAASATLSLAPGAAATQKITLTVNANFTGSATLTVTGLPAGVTASWSANPVTLASQTAASTLTLSAAASTKASTYAVTVKAAGDGVTATQAFTLKIT